MTGTNRALVFTVAFAAFAAAGVVFGLSIHQLVRSSSGSKPVNVAVSGRETNGAWPEENSAVRLAAASLGLLLPVLVLALPLKAIPLFGTVAGASLSLAAAIMDGMKVQDAWKECDKSSSASVECSNREFVVVLVFIVLLLALFLVETLLLCLCGGKRNSSTVEKMDSHVQEEELLAVQPTPKPPHVPSTPAAQRNRDEDRPIVSPIFVPGAAVHNSESEQSAPPPASARGNDHSATQNVAQAPREAPPSASKSGSEASRAAPASAGAGNNAAPHTTVASPRESSPSASKNTESSRPVPVTASSTNNTASQQVAESPRTAPASAPAAASSGSEVAPRSSTAGARTQEDTQPKPEDVPDILLPAETAGSEAEANPPTLTSAPSFASMSSPTSPRSEESDMTVAQVDAMDALRALDVLRSRKVVLGAKFSDAGSGGITVTDATRGGSMLQALLIDGDFVTHIDGTAVEFFRDVRPILNKHIPGDVIPLKVTRVVSRIVEEVMVELGGEKLSLEVVRRLRAKAGLPIADGILWTRPTAQARLDAMKPWAGFRCVKSGSSLKVSEVSAGGPATRAKPPVTVGMVILAIDRVTVSDVAELTRELGKKKSGEMVVFQYSIPGKSAAAFTQVELGAEDVSQERVRALRELAGFLAVSATGRS